MVAGPQEMVSVIARYDRIYDLYRNCILNELTTAAASSSTAVSASG